MSSACWESMKTSVGGVDQRQEWQRRYSGERREAEESNERLGLGSATLRHCSPDEEGSKIWFALRPVNDLLVRCSVYALQYDRGR